MLGAHVIKSWVSTQASIALSSGEAEFNGVEKGAGVALGYQSLLRDLGHDVSLRVWTDSTAAIGIASRQGLGKLRHLDTHTLWIQQAVRSKRFALHKIDGLKNPADLFTKHAASRDKLQSLVNLYECRFTGGRAAAAPLTRTTQGTRLTMAAGKDVPGTDDIMMAIPQDEPIMPHLLHMPESLEQEYPPLDVAQELHDCDVEGQGEDALQKVGEKEAENIIEQAAIHGRRRWADMHDDE